MPSGTSQATDFRPAPSGLALLVSLAALTALLSLYLWTELLLARAGGATLCGLSDPGACARLWEGPFASTVHRLTGLPVAGWGLAWALAATALPLVALVHTARQRPLLGWLSAVRLTAAGGFLAVLGLMFAAFQAKTLCIGCLLTYGLVLGYAGIALIGWRSMGLPERGRGLGLSLATLALAFGALIYPGLRTPSSRTVAGRAAISSAGGGAASVAAAQVTGDDEVSRFVASLAPGLRQTLSDALYLYRAGMALPLEPPRALIGEPTAPLRISEFTDVRCGTCADLQETLAALEQRVPAGSFSVEPRHFPLDGECNPYVRQASDPVRCLAARARICVENRPGASEFAQRMFRVQETLNIAEVYRLAEDLVPRAELAACIVSAETARKLRADIESAVRYRLEGTPLVLLNGRKAVSFPPFLYAMILTSGRTDHPAFEGLPTPNPSAHIH
jgi:serine/threonine-protein kinase